MIRSDDHSTVRRNVLNAVKFNLKKNTTENADQRPDHVKGPLRQHLTSGRRPRVLFPGRKCSVRTQMLTLAIGLILQRPFLINELDVNSRNSVDAGVLRPNRRIGRDVVLLARQANETARRKLQRRK